MATAAKTKASGAKKASPRSTRAAVTTDRRLQALELRKEGLAFSAIGDRLGISKEAAWKLVENALIDYRESVKETADVVRELELMRLDELTEAVRKLALTGEPAQVAVYLKTMERRSKLLGLDAAAKTELTGANGGSLKTENTNLNAGVDLSSLSTDDLAVLTRILGGAAPESDGE